MYPSHKDKSLQILPSAKAKKVTVHIICVKLSVADWVGRTAKTSELRDLSRGNSLHITLQHFRYH